MGNSDAGPCHIYLQEFWSNTHVCSHIVVHVKEYQEMGGGGYQVRNNQPIAYVSTEQKQLYVHF